MFARLAQILNGVADDALVVVDMPIGLPDRIEGAGRVAEQAARPLLCKRRSSLFAVPARPVVERFGARPRGRDAIRAAFAEACLLAREHSTPPSAFSIQGFALLPRIAEVDALLRSDPARAKRMVEGHPEVAFAVLNGGAEMAQPKTTQAGQVERRELLLRLGLPPVLMKGPRPGEAGEDDRLDACALLLVAGRVARGEALSFPDPPGRDGYGLPIAIRA